MSPQPLRLALAVAGALYVAACSATSGQQAGAPAQGANAATSSAAARPEVCPRATLREGTGTLRRGEANSALSATIAQVSRACALDDGQVVIEVRVAGNVTPAGPSAAGSVELPIRVAVVSGDTLLYSQMGRQSVAVPGGGQAQSFTFVDRAVTIPADTAAQAQVFVGFDEMR